jgi:hypothetical protein
MLHRPVLRPTHPPIQWVLAVLFPGYSGRGVKLSTTFQLVKKTWLYYINSPVRLLGKTLSYLRAWTIYISVIMNCKHNMARIVPADPEINSESADIKLKFNLFVFPSRP